MQHLKQHMTQRINRQFFTENVRLGVALAAVGSLVTLFDYQVRVLPAPLLAAGLVALSSGALRLALAYRLGCASCRTRLTVGRLQLLPSSSLNLPHALRSADPGALAALCVQARSADESTPDGPQLHYRFCPACRDVAAVERPGARRTVFAGGATPELVGELANGGARRQRLQGSAAA